jgi:hypothetical protein
MRPLPVQRAQGQHAPVLEASERKCMALRVMSIVTLLQRVEMTVHRLSRSFSASLGTE